MRWIACALLSVLVATCGQKGPLTLPDEASSQVLVRLADELAGAIADGPLFTAAPAAPPRALAMWRAVTDWPRLATDAVRRAETTETHLAVRNF